MIRACRRCRPGTRPGVMVAQRVAPPGWGMIEEYVSLCTACRSDADAENLAGSRRLAKSTDVLVLEALFTAPSTKEPAR